MGFDFAQPDKIVLEKAFLPIFILYEIHPIVCYNKKTPLNITSKGVLKINIVR